MGKIVASDEWDLAGSPCEEVAAGSFCHYPLGVSQRYPREVGIESYLGAPLRDSGGRILGHLAVFDSRGMPAADRMLYTFQIFATRAATELNRLNASALLRESEARFHDLFDEAPIAYVHEDLDSRFIRANRAALRILGLTPEQIPGMVGISLVPKSTEAQSRVREAFASIGRGVDTSGVVLELSRKDNGKPVFVQWWSRPDPSGQYTRTMFIDVTERILMERSQAKLEAQNLHLREEIKSTHNFEEIVDRSPAIQAVLKNVERVAVTDASVLIRGETGTGKELLARAIHSASDRRDKPLIKVNCAALPAGLVESELFGHEKGAFTGAIAKRIGRFELADGGTIFLDEIGEVPPEVQVKLLRVLQEREIDRVGGTSPIKLDVRVIAATNCDLLQAVKEKTFREDLFYRLNVFPVISPPLRDRIDDVPLLVHFMLGKFSKKIGKRITEVGAISLQRLCDYRWPGNIRELENVIERAVILSDGPLLEIDPEMLPGLVSAASGAARSTSEPDPNSLEAVERQHILAVLEQKKWVIEGPRGAAKILELRPSTLRYRMKILDIAAARHRPQ